ncbi:hypothetical protein MKZ38_003301 [Zalerion maritima]|uniref:Tho complex subunit 7 n=1 Tax=Zalerion maritima TaxID=339359 RepID=A0AAD5WRY7_9PEZI|nr:hypothetical protein MKZ38_003301 [Zalerion maritima]
MASSAWGFPTEEEEKELHKIRLLNVEEKPFKRITKRVNAIKALVQERVRHPMTPPPDGAADAEAPASATTNGDEKQTPNMEQTAAMKEELTLDFSAFDSSIARIQFLMDANVRERQRYAADKGRIMDEAQSVRDNTAELRVQLEQAKATLAQRRKFDELADKTTSSKMLRPRDEQHVNLKKLEEECEDLESESESYAVTWRERREQFNKIIEEGMQLRRLIRDEKDDFDRREGMEDGEEEGETASQGGQTPRQVGHGNTSPNQDVTGNSQSQSRGGETPRPHSSGGRSNRANTPNPDRQDGLKPLPSRVGEIARSGSRAASREASPNHGEDEGEIEEGEDVEMGGPRITVDSPRAGDKMDTA